MSKQEINERIRDTMNCLVVQNKQSKTDTNNCLTAKKGYMENYENKNQAYKDRVITNAYCIPFDSFPLTTMKSTGA